MGGPHVRLPKGVLDGVGNGLHLTEDFPEQMTKKSVKAATDRRSSTRGSIAFLSCAAWTASCIAAGRPGAFELRGSSQSYSCKTAS